MPTRILVDSSEPQRINKPGDIYCSCACRGVLEKHDDFKQVYFDELLEPAIVKLEEKFIKPSWKLNYYDIKIRPRKRFNKGFFNVYIFVEGLKNKRYAKMLNESVGKALFHNRMPMILFHHFNYEGNPNKYDMGFWVITFEQVPISAITQFLSEEDAVELYKLMNIPITKNAESDEKTQAKEVIEALQNAGYEALFVGGAVRDKLMGLEPKDYDIGSSATPEQVAEVVNNMEGYKYLFGPEGDRAKRALTSLINPPFGEQIEVTTFRKEMYGKDRADIDAIPAKTFKEDSARRDLTINALGETLDGEIIDYHNGREDIEKGIVRTVGNPDERFKEDPLRMIRAIRFAVKYNFDIDKTTWESIKKNKELVNDLSSKRRRDEIGKALVYPNGFTLLMESGILPTLMPEFRNMKDYHHKLDYHPEDTLYNHYIEAFNKFTTIPNRTELGAWALLFHDIAKPQTAEWNEEGGYHTFYGHDKQGSKLVLENYNNTNGPFEFSKKELQAIAWTTDNHLGRFWEMKKPIKVANLRNNENYPLLVEVVTGDTMGIRRGGDEQLDARLKEIDKITQEVNKKKEKVGNRPPDFAPRMIKELGLQGKQISDTLNKIEEMISTGVVNSYDEALEVLKSKNAEGVFTNYKLWGFVLSSALLYKMFK